MTRKNLAALALALALLCLAPAPLSWGYEDGGAGRPNFVPGPPGLRGEKGDKGDKGDTGTQGIPGPTGAAGPVNGVRYTFSGLTTDADPGPGTLRFNATTLTSVTALYIDNVDALAGGSQTAWIDGWDDSTNTSGKGSITLQNNADPSQQVVFRVIGAVVDGSGYRKVPVAYQSGIGGFTENVSLGIVFARDGDQGGTTGGTFVRADQAQSLNATQKNQARSNIDATCNFFKETLYTTVGSFTHTYDASTTYVVAEVLGGGGGGGAADPGGAANASSGAGGGAGGYVKKIFLRGSVTTASINIGAGGVGGVAATNNGLGGSGTNSTYSDGITTLTAGGGQGGVRGTGVPNVLFLQGALGGTATGGDINAPGTPGGAATEIGSSTAGTNVASTTGGNGGSSMYGAGGLGAVARTVNGTADGTAGSAASGYGAGGGGAAQVAAVSTVKIGGAGTSGNVALRECH